MLALSLLRLDGWPPALTEWSDPDVAFFLPLPFLAILGVIATIGFLWLRPGAWVVAMLVQCLHLIVTLTFYFFFEQRTFYLFAMMFFAVVMVVYLNYAEVPAVFRVAPGQEADSSEAADRAAAAVQPVLRFTRGERFFPMRVEPYRNAPACVYASQSRSRAYCSEGS